MNRRHCLRALTSITVCALLPGAAFAAAQKKPVNVSQTRTINDPIEPVVQFIPPDPLYAHAVAVVMINQRASIGLVQRHLKLGYNRAARLLESMEQAGLISSLCANGYRQILASDQFPQVPNADKYRDRKPIRSRPANLVLV